MPISKDIGGVTFNPKSTQGVESSAVGVADLISGLGKVAHGVYQEKAKEALVGPEGAQVPGLEGFGEARVSPSDEFDMDRALNLRQIKKARDQGLLTATQARLKVNQAIRSVAADFPGQEDTLRKRAGVFFGQFGEGDLSLTASESEKAQQSIYLKQFIGPGVKAGIIDPLDPLNDKEGQADWQKIIHNSTIRKQQQESLQAQAEVGKATGQELTSAYIRSSVGDDIGVFISKTIQMQKAGQLITDPQQLKLSLTQQKTLHKQELRNRLTRVPMTSEQRKDALSEIDAAYKDLEDIIDNGTFAKMLENRQDLLTKMATVYSIEKYPELFAAEKVAPGIGSQLVGLAETFNRLKNDASRQAFINRQPPIMQGFMRSTLDDPMSIAKIMAEQIKSNVVQGNEFFDKLAESLARKGMHDPLVGPEGVNENFKDMSIGYYLRHAEGVESLEELTSASVADRLKKDSKKVDMLGNKFVTNEQAIIPEANQIVNEGRQRGRSLDIAFNPANKQFELNIQVDQPASQYPESAPHLSLGNEQAIVDRLNTLNKVVNYYGDVLKIDPIKWREQVLKEINKPVEEEPTE